MSPFQTSCMKHHISFQNGSCRAKCLRAQTLQKLSCPANCHRLVAARATQPERDKVVPTFTAKDATAARMMNFQREFALAEGRVVIQALTVPLIDQTAELLASSFVSSVSHLVPYASYVRRNIVRYLREHQAMVPDAVVLVAVLQPVKISAEVSEPNGVPRGQPVALEANDAAEAPPTSAIVPGLSSGFGGSVSGEGHQDAISGPYVTLPRVIGSAEVSFKSITRSAQPFLDPPQDSCYLCNMAVSPQLRRRGVATQLLMAAEEIATDVVRKPEVYLHLRFVDKEAAALYDRLGFRAQAEHWPVVPLLGIQRMKLMRKDLVVNR